MISSIDGKIQSLKQQPEVEAPKTRTEAVKAVKGKVAALAESMDSYAFEPLPESALAFDDRQLEQTGTLRPWLEMLVHEDRSPYTTQASKLLQQIDLIQEASASYLLENGEILSLLREGDQVHYTLTDSLQNPVSEGLLGEPDLMLDAARDLSLSEAGRDGLTATLLTAEAIDHLNALRISEPMVSFSHSQHAQIPDGLSMPLSQANRLMERLDQRQAIDRQKSDYAGPLTYSTDFRVEYIKEGLPAAYTGKQEIGAGDGSLSHHMQLTVQEALSDRSWRNYLKEMGETQLQADPNALGEVRDELLPYFNQHQALTFLKERKEVYQAGLPNVAEEKREALSAYYGDVTAYVQESRQQMNLSQNPQTLDFPQLDQYLNANLKERDLDLDGSPERVDIDDQDSRVQLTHHLDKRDGVSEKQSVRERLRSGKAEHSRMQIENENHREVEIR